MQRGPLFPSAGSNYYFKNPNIFAFNNLKGQNSLKSNWIQRKKNAYLHFCCIHIQSRITESQDMYTLIITCSLFNILKTQ